MSVRSIRITEEIETAVRYVADREHAAQAQSLRKLARMGFEAYVAGQYRVWEALDLDRLAALGATGNASGESVLAALATLEAPRKPL